MLPIVLPESGFLEVEKGGLFCIGQEKKETAAFESEPLHVDLFCLAVPFELFVGCVLGSIKRYIVVEEFVLMQSQVTGGLETEGLADFDVLITLGDDVVLVDGGMFVVFEPERTFTGEGGVFEADGHASHDIEFVAFRHC